MAVNEINKRFTEMIAAWLARHGGGLNLGDMPADRDTIKITAGDTPEALESLSNLIDQLWSLDIDHIDAGVPVSAKINLLTGQHVKTLAYVTGGQADFWGAKRVVTAILDEGAREIQDKGLIVITAETLSRVLIRLDRLGPTFKQLGVVSIHFVIEVTQ